MSWLGTLIRKFTERQARKYGVAGIVANMEKSGAKVHGRMETAVNDDKHREAARHIIGIERWSQSRLRVALGKPLVMDEYDDYRPEAHLDMVALAQTFAQTRQESLALAEQLQTANIPASQTIPHNQLGDLTVQGWLYYIENHAARESFRLR
jgi:hypothetical protein